ncbi:MAG: hypothetical protein ACYCOU_18325 [Sulfobacillus sp.]
MTRYALSRGGFDSERAPAQSSAQISIAVMVVFLVILGSFATGLGSPESSQINGSVPAPASRRIGSPISDGPTLAPEDYVGLSCTGGEIKLNGTVVCDNQGQQPPVPLCGSSFCNYTLTGIDLNPQATVFTGWNVGGTAQVACGDCLTTNLELVVPNPQVTSSGVVTLSLQSQTQPRPQVSVTVHAFVDYVTGTAQAKVSICNSANACLTYSNGQVASLTVDASYNFTAVTNLSPFQWTSTAGNISNGGLGSTSIYISSAGTVALIVILDSNWAGFIYTPPTSNLGVTSVSVQFRVPSIESPSYEGLGIWVGIGGTSLAAGSQSNLWQAGIYVNGTSTGAWIDAFWEEFNGTGTHFLQQNLTSMHISPGDLVNITVTSSNGISTATIDDLTPQKSMTTTQHYQATTTTGEWIEEPHGLVSGGTIQRLTFTFLEIDGGSPSLVGCYLGTKVLLQVHQTWIPSQLVEVGGQISFSIS